MTEVTVGRRWGRERKRSRRRRRSAPVVCRNPSFCNWNRDDMRYLWNGVYGVCGIESEREGEEEKREEEGRRGGEGVRG